MLCTHMFEAETAFVDSQMLGGSIAMARNSFFSRLTLRKPIKQGSLQIGPNTKVLVVAGKSLSQTCSDTCEPQVLVESKWTLPSGKSASEALNFLGAGPGLMPYVDVFFF